MLQDGSTDKDGCRAQKLSILNKIKCLETANDNANRLLFPIHHKYLKDNRNLNNSNYNNIDNVTTDDVEKIILSAYETAKVLIDNLKMCKLLKQNKIYTLKRLSTYISNSVRSSSNVTDNTMIDDDVDNESDTSSSSGNEDNDYYGEDNESENISEGEDDDKILLDHFAQHPVKSVVDVVDDVKTELKQQIKKLRPVAIACEVEAETLEKIIQDINDSEARSGESIEKEFGHLVNLLSTTKKRLREELKRKSQICRDNVHSRQEKLNNVKSSLNRGLREAEHTFSSQAIAQTIASAGCVVEAPNRISMKTSSLALNTWIPVASMSSARRHHTATLLSSGKVLVAGGHSSNSLSSCEVNDPPSNRWTPVASMSSPRFWHTATLLSSGKVLVTGGYTNSNSLSSCEVNDPPSNRWTPVASMSSPRFWHTATLLSSGKLLVT
ncbi:unnamed protein product, partial [Didymodactylos carnosus]